MKALCAAVVALSLVSVASADLICVVDQNPDPQAGLKSYTVSFVGTTPGDALSAFDGRFEGVMSQTWYNWKGWLTTAWVGDFLLPAEAASAAVDSHMLIDPHDPDHVLVASGVSEDFDENNIIETTVDGYDRALGTYIATTATSNMAFAIPGAYQTINQIFAQIVIPDGETVRLLGTAVSNNGTGLPLGIDVPEPATMVLLTLSGAGLVLRRRRK